MNFDILTPDAIDFDSERVEKELALTQKSLNQYEFDVSALGLVQANAKAVVWRVDTSQGPKALKWIGRKSDKAVFSLLAHRYMEEIGFRVPRIARTKDDRFYLAEGRRVGFVAEWIEGRPVLRDDDDEWRLFLGTLAEFHKVSRGLKSPAGTRIKTKLGGWPLNYQAKIGRMKLWYSEAGKKQHPFFARYRELAPAVIDQAENLLERLAHSGYWDWIHEEMQSPSLCHSDFGESNTVLTPKGDLYVIDLDTVTHDLPVRDLRKVFESYLDPGVDLAGAMRRVVTTYTQFNALNDKRLEVFFIDVQFPYKFYQTAKMGFVLNEFDELGLIEEAQLDLARAEAVSAF